MIKTLRCWFTAWDSEANSLIDYGWELIHFSVSGDGAGYFVGVFQKDQDNV